MSRLLILQVLALQLLVLVGVGNLSKLIVKRLCHPSSVASRIACWWGEVFLTALIGFVLVVTVPGRMHHLDSFKLRLMDEVAIKEFNGGGTGLKSWLGMKISNLTADIVVQQMRVEQIGGVSIGLIEADWGWVPVSVGFAGIVCPNFFFYTPTYETPDVIVMPKKGEDGNWQVELHNAGNVEYECTVSSWINPDKSPLCKFDLKGESGILIRQQQKSFVNSVKRLLGKDKTVVTIPEPIAQGLCIAFKRGQRVFKCTRLTQTGDDLCTDWYDPGKFPDDKAVTKDSSM